MKETTKLFWKDARDNFLSHIGGWIVCSIFAIAFLGFINDDKQPLIQLAIGVLFLIIYSFPVYGTMWRQGYRDLNKQQFNRVQKDVTRGFRVGLAAAIPYFVMVLLLFMTKLELFPNFLFVFRLLNAEIWPFINIINVSPWMPEFSWLQLIGVGLLTMIPAVLSGCFYLLGNHDIQPWNRLVYVKKKDVKTKQ
ncbi:hypothetical protein RBG61_13350 [Paludicola sp. MB14-C6]|uniref:hypothetical protein n=1 Tax=Paludihabitans sp. MB14-C6 TaxID=3070656 RepID=UPI0027DC7DEC|nr:hypothetical protein [Paludicola sp. MB14-C6]WMJ22959.1 hypothetical protein RBG61_13350 [Paludicola sp. MB14-C6]